MISRNEVYESKIISEEYRCKAITEFLSICRGTQEFPGIVFTRQKKHAKILAEKISAKIGIEVPVITAQVNKEIRRNTVKRMADRDPTLPFVVATGVWKTGINIPSLRFVLLADAGQAPIGLLQAAGRATRKDEGKESFKIYDLQDWNADERYDEYNKLREGHCKRAGFKVEEAVDISALGHVESAVSTEREPDESAPAQEIEIEVDRTSARELLESVYRSTRDRAPGERDASTSAFNPYAMSGSDWFWLAILLASAFIFIFVR